MSFISNVFNVFILHVCIFDAQFLLLCFACFNKGNLVLLLTYPILLRYFIKLKVTYSYSFSELRYNIILISYYFLHNVGGLSLFACTYLSNF